VAYRDTDSGHSWDLHGAIVPNPLSTFFMRAQGDGLRSHGIHSGDLLVIDRSLPLRSGAVVVIAQGGHFLVRPLIQQDESWLALPLNPQQPALPIARERIEHSGLFGVVAHVVHHLNSHQGRGRTTPEPTQRGNDHCDWPAPGDAREFRQRSQDQYAWDSAKNPRIGKIGL
jgi:hypothetical protein